MTERVLPRRLWRVVVFCAVALAACAVGGSASADPPSFSQPPDITVEATGPDGASVSYDVSSFVSDENGTASVSCSPDSGSTFAITTTPVSCTATDLTTDQTSSVTFNVTVQDTTPPVITPPSPGPAEAQSASGAAVTFTANARDLVDGTFPASCDPASGSTFPIGTTTVTCNASDHAGNAAAAVTFSVVVQDTTPPAVTINAPSATVAAADSSGAHVTYSASAVDLVDGNLTASCTPASGSLFPLGPTQIQCSAIDARGNPATVVATVTVADLTPPTLVVPAPITVEATSPGGNVVDFAAAAQDAIDGPVAVACNPASGSTFAVKTTTVSCSAHDSANNTQTATFTVNVTDTTAPSLVVPSTVQVQATGPDGATVTFTPTSTDIVDGSLTPTCAPASGTIFPIGDTTVRCTARDAHGNAVSKTFDVQVSAAAVAASVPAAPSRSDSTPPSITTPPGLTVSGDRVTGAVVSYSVSATDGIDGTVPVSCTPAAGSRFALGQTVVACTARDAAGNVASKSFKVTVLDRTPPPAVQLRAPVVSGGRVVLRWTNPTTPDLDHVEVARTDVAAGKTAVLYSGQGTTFTDAHVRAGARYRYTVYAVDASGNRDGVAVIVGGTASPLAQPLAGAHVSGPPALVWSAVARATYYNVQLFHNGTKVLSVWVSHPRLQLGRTWKFAGRRQKLVPGPYRWYVFPGFGARRAHSFGHVLGTSTFVVSG